MKKLLMTLAASATTVVASAAIKSSEGFESNLGGFSGDGEAVAYSEDVKAPTSQNYPFSGANTQYCSVLDTLTSPAVTGATCFDMFVQFPKDVSEQTPNLDELGEDAKVAVYLNSTTNICVVYGNGNGGHETYEGPEVKPDTWARLTIAKGDSGYAVYINSVLIETFAPITSSGDLGKVEFTGSGKLDNFVARTTNPFYEGTYAASVGTGDDNEKYATYSAALADVLDSGATATITIPGETPKTLDGKAANPYEITCLDDLKAFQAAVADKKGLNKCYKLTADITLDAAWPGIGLQNGKDDVSNATKFDVAAFCGTFDGQNHTISNFQMQGGGLDYCGFFNSICGATIKNLKIQYAGALFATDTTATSAECGAAFVGVAKNSTLQNLTTLAGTVSCSKGFGGIVGYLSYGSTVESCTNNVNMTSLKPNKCGGIAMITQNGSAVTIRNCQNNGTVAGSNEIGSLVGYIGLATTIENCESTVAYKLLHHQSSTLTVSGITADALVASYTGAATPGLNFATVAGDVATFVADNALATDGTVYKVMNANAAYEFTAAGTLVLDEALTNATVTAASPLELGSTTAGSVTTYTAFAPVAAIGETKYPTLGAAVAVATAGDTVKLLGNVTLDARVEPNLGAGTALTIDLGGYTITRTGTSGNGSAFDVKSGTVVITNGVIDCTQDDAAIVADGVYALTVRSGAALTLDALTVTVDSQAGACVYPFNGATVTINGGTYRNNTAEEYQYKTGWTGMAVNQANVATQLITIYGGSFWQVNPAEGDDSGNVTTFLASGYESKLVEGYWVVSEKEDTGIDPDVGEASYDTEADANAATVAVPEGIEVAPAVYDGYFKKTVAYNEDTSKWVVTAELDATKVLPVEEAETAMLEDLEAVATGSEATATVPTKAGLYYWIAGAGEVDAVNYTNGTAQLGDGTAKELAKPALTGLDGKAFYKVCAGVKDPAKQ